MASLAMCPPEIILRIAHYLDDNEHDLAALALVCRATYVVVNFEIYRGAWKKYPYLLCWASEFGKLGTVRTLLAAGANAKTPWGRGGWPWCVIDGGHPLCSGLKAGHAKYSPDYMLYEFYGHQGRKKAVEIIPDRHPSGLDVGVDDRDTQPPSSPQEEDEDVSTVEMGDQHLEMFEDVNGGVLDSQDAGAMDGERPLPFTSRGWMEDDPGFPSLNLDSLLAGTQQDQAWIESGQQMAWCPLHLAAMGGHVAVAELLLDHGADPNAMGRRVCGCRHAALNCADRHSTADGLSREEEANKELRDRDVIVTPLHVALCHQQQEMALMLLRRGAARTFDAEAWKSHAIHTAAVHGCLDVIKFLVEEDDDTINLKDLTGLTPLYYAYSTRQRETFLWLLEHRQLRVDARLGAGLTLLHLACIDGAFAIACRLVDAGADVNCAWSRKIIPYLGKLRPLEVCCALHHSKSRRLYAAGDALLHERRFELRRLELMKKLLNAGARTGPIERRARLVGHGPNVAVSAVTLAASHHSVPMLQLLAMSGATNMAQEASAVHEAIYPASMRWRKAHPSRNPLTTLRWLVAHGVPVETDTDTAADTMAVVCSLPPTNFPWKADVLEWLLDHHVHPDHPILVSLNRSSTRRKHPMLVPPDKIYPRVTTGFQEALMVQDFPACKALTRRGSSYLNLKDAFRRVLDRIMADGPHSVDGWPCTIYSDPEERRLESIKWLAFLLEVDEKETIKNSPDTFWPLFAAREVPPSDLLLATPLPSEDAIMKKCTAYRREKKLWEEFCEMRRQYEDSSTNASRQTYSDLTFRLFVAILLNNWNAAHFLALRRGERDAHDDDGLFWANSGEAREYFRAVLESLRQAPLPSSIGHGAYQALLARWNKAWQREDRAIADVRTVLFHEACEGPLDAVTLFLKLPDRNGGGDEDDGGGSDDQGHGDIKHHGSQNSGNSSSIDVNAVDGRGDSALHRLLSYIIYEMRFNHSDDGSAARQLMALLRAGVDPRIVNDAQECVFSHLRFVKDQLFGPGLPKGLEVVSVVDNARLWHLGTAEITLRFEGLEETFAYPPSLNVGDLRPKTATAA
ncbi:uncharacterized protein E0L32_004994 [Thyridium curvatum]|uniref:Uncharacterized protein n=1 Tax=Thyridium curvatum TaxID=1093900 RepID=A0A507AVR4_9PEZI|nr:uncharacterized protein E0L32_004994 [Thyridium curvatum]TPX14885.1 hypothetical protein E0L32_004994 [Thyridium curvatum]